MDVFNERKLCVVCFDPLIIEFPATGLRSPLYGSILSVAMEVRIKNESRKMKTGSLYTQFG